MDWIAPGAVLAGKYTLERKLGQGGMGAVWVAEHVQLRSPVAIKVIDQQIATNPDALARFLREAQSAAALRSPHVVQILDFGADRGVPYIAMELLEGESLADRLARVGRMQPAEVARLVTQIARALGKAHEMGIVHRDIKPDNIFIVRNDEEDVAKVLDFGIAKSSQGLGVGSGSTTRTGAILGTPNYMSPEQAEGTKQVDHRTDLWALGVIVFEALIGRKPFDSDALGSLLLAICTRPIPIPSQWGYQHPGFDAWFARACARELHDRFQSARELAVELRQICGVGDARELAALGAPTVRAVTPAGPQTPSPYGSPPQTPYSSGAQPSRSSLPQTPYAPGQQFPYTQVAPPLPTANTYSASVSMATRRAPIAALLLGGLLAAGALAGGLMFLLRKDPAQAPAEAAASVPATAAPKPVVEPAPTTPAPIVIPTSALDVIPAPSAASAAAEAEAAPLPVRRGRPPAPVRKPPKTAAATPVPAPAPVAPPEPKPEPRPEPPKPPSNRVNLGI